VAAHKGRGRRPGWATAANEIVDRIFVYGTLRAGQPARSMMAEHVVSSEPATLPGAIYAFPDGYPGYTPSTDGTVVGELVTLRDLTAAFLLLDAYEGDDYDRVLSKATTEGGDQVWCWVYQLKDPALTARGAPIPSGDWNRYAAGG
jgi:gamma-glutamylcyclotransferase (GGCT)/AIG2-like uncharacterized protein YtfP